MHQGQGEPQPVPHSSGFPSLPSCLAPYLLLPGRDCWGRALPPLCAPSPHMRSQKGIHEDPIFSVVRKITTDCLLSPECSSPSSPTPYLLSFHPGSSLVLRTGVPGGHPSLNALMSITCRLTMTSRKHPRSTYQAYTREEKPFPCFPSSPAPKGFAFLPVPSALPLGLM